MKFGLKDETIQKIIGIFQKYSCVREVYLYGSRANGNFKKGSDIDLTLKGDNIDLTTMNRIANEIDDLLLPYTFDISIFTHLDNDSLIEHINRVGILFYQRK